MNIRGWSIVLVVGIVLLAAGVSTAREAASSAPADGGVNVAVMESEAAPAVKAADAKALAGWIDTVLTQSAASRKLTLVDRQALDKVLAETTAVAGGAAKVAPEKLDKAIRPFWAAGVMICPRVGPPKTPRSSPNEMVVTVEAVLAQTGQLVAALRVTGIWEAGRWMKEPNFAGLDRFWADVARNVARNARLPVVEVSDGKLVSKLTRLGWMLDDMTDSLRAAVGVENGVVLLVPRCPSSTKEERLLRVMGLSLAKGGDAAAGLAPAPQARVSIELTEAVKENQAFDATEIQAKITFANGSAGSSTFKGTVGKYEDMKAEALKWASSQLLKINPQKPPPAEQDDKFALQLAKEELDAARQLVADTGNRYDWFSYGSEQAVLARIARHALRSAHLDPTSEESARYIALTCDALYPPPAPGAASPVRYDRVIAECHRYLDRFRKQPEPYNPTFQVMQKCADAGRNASYPFWKSGGGRYATTPDYEYYRYAKVDVDNSIPLYCAWVAVQGMDNIWAVCNRLRHEVFSNCPEDELEKEHDRWREFWRTTVDKIKHEEPAPPFAFVEIGYYVRKKDYQSVRRLYGEMAQKFHRLHNLAWATRIPCTEPLWKEQLCLNLRAAGDPDWKTWEPTFAQAAGEVFYPKLFDWDEFFFRLNPAMPDLWASSSPLVGATLTFPKAVLESGGKDCGDCRVSALCVAGDEMIFVSPGINNVYSSPNAHTLFAAPLSKLLEKGQTIAVEPVKIDWPSYPNQDGDDASLPIQVKSSLVTVRDGGATLWIGTKSHGVARLGRKDGKWVGRWFTGKDGLPVQCVDRMTTCLHDGKPKVLAMGTGTVKDAKGQTNTVVWTMDEESGAAVLLADSRQNPNISGQMMLTWPTGQTVLLDLYNRASFGDLDLKNATFGPPPKPWYELIRGCDAKRPWGTDHVRIAPVDPKTFAMRSGPPGGGGAGATPFYDEQTYFIAMLPTRAMQSVDMPGQAPIYPIDYASAQGEWLWLGMNGTRYSGHTATLSAYRPAPADRDWMNNDRWIPPLAMPGGGYIRAVFNDGKRLWVATTTNTICRIDCVQYVEKALAAGQAVSTSQWQKQFQERGSRANWRSNVQLLLGRQKVDEAIAATAERMAKSDRADPAGRKEWTDAALWQAAAMARVPETRSKAIDLYVRLSDDKRLEPTARAFAMINLIKVSHVAGQWQRVLNTADKLVRMFPELKPEGSSTLPWFIGDAKAKLAAQSQPATRPANPSTHAAAIPAR